MWFATRNRLVEITERHRHPGRTGGIDDAIGDAAGGPHDLSFEVRGGANREVTAHRLVPR